MRFDSYAPSIVANIRVGVGGCADIGLTASLLGATAESTLCVINTDAFILSVNPAVGLVNYEIGDLVPYFGNLWHGTVGVLADVPLGKTTLSFGARGGAASIDDDTDPLVGFHALATFWLTDQESAFGPRSRRWGCSVRTTCSPSRRSSG